MSVDPDATELDEGPAARVAAHLAGLDLDVETLELIMAALTADVCDQFDTSAI